MSKPDAVEIFKHNGRKLRRKVCTTSALLANKGDIGPKRSSISSLPPRSVILPPPKPPTLSRKGRPMSAKGRPSPQATVSSLEQADEFRLRFALQHSNPLPPIGKKPDPQPSDDQLTDVDSAVDLDYVSQCGEPPYLPPDVKISRSHSSYDDSSEEHDSREVQLRLKLLSGKCIDAEFPLYATLHNVYEYAQRSSSEDLSNCVICSNEIPRREFHDKTVTLREAGILVRTMLYFIQT